MLAPAGDVYQAGTLSGNPLAVAAALATLELLDDGAYRRLGELTARLAQGLAEAAAEAGEVPVQVQSVPGLLTVFFAAAPIDSFEAARACDLETYARWCRELIARGVYAPASQFEAWFPSLAHSEEQIDRTIEIAAAAFASLAGREGRT
jgi:glutamate-1-semialdehyde 2,1-aminomutase